MRTRSTSSTRWQRACAAATLLGVLLGLAGVPAVAPRDKDRSQPFPCQDRPCGCLSAEQCWRHCCCFTNREKVAWARKHRVAVPEFVIAAAEREESTSEGTCCAGGCCETSHEKQAPVAESAGDEPIAGLIVSELARRCQGLPDFWQLLADALPLRVRPALIASVQAGTVVELAESLVSAPAAPPVPPPKLAHRHI